MKPTVLNIKVLAGYVEKAKSDTLPNVFESTAMSHVRRCLKAGLLEVADRATLKLTPLGVAAVAGYLPDYVRDRLPRVTSDAEAQLAALLAPTPREKTAGARLDKVARRVYTRAEFHELSDVFMAAQAMAATDSAEIEDEGTCVLGAGIAIDYVPPRMRSPLRKIVVVAKGLQGNMAQFAACKRALHYLHENGIAAYWYDGAMD